MTTALAGWLPVHGGLDQHSPQASPGILATKGQLRVGAGHDFVIEGDE